MVTPVAALPLFLQASALAKSLKADFYTVDALHMLGIAAAPKDRLAWNQKAIAAAEGSDEKGRGWLASLYNNTGWALFDEERYAEALDLFDRAIGLREQQFRAARIAIAEPCQCAQAVAADVLHRRFDCRKYRDESDRYQDDDDGTRRQRGRPVRRS